MKEIDLLEKQGEQEPVDYDIEIPFGAKDSELIEETYYIPEGMEAIIEDNKVIIRKKETYDEKIIRRIKLAIEDYWSDELLQEILAWLEKQKAEEWSEEDKSMMQNIIYTLEPLSQTTHSGYAIGSMINWLKSLKPKPINVEAALAYQDGYQKAVIELSQNKWKPTEEQMTALGIAIADSFEQRHHNDLLSLDYNLKKNLL